MRRRHPLHDWRTPIVTVAGMALAVGLVSVAAPTFVDTHPSALILAAVLAMTLSRNRLAATWRGRAEAVILLPFISLATAGVAYLLLTIPVVGAAGFVVAIFLSIWLRRFGPVWRRIGSLIALPFITLLIVPGGAGSGTSATPPWVAAVLSLVALVVVVALRLLAEATHFLPRESSAKTEQTGPPRKSSLRPVASTRMAIQMATGLVVAVIVGVLLFPQHVPWVVLTAFLVASGNRGRADVLYKSGLRILGAAAGSIAASVLVVVVPPTHPIASGPLFVVILLAIIAVGLWLRSYTYAAWALVVTLDIALLQGVIAPANVAAHFDPWLRVLAIIVGAICGLAAAWFVLPVRSEPIVRLRVAGVLAALSEFASARRAEDETALAESDHRVTLALGGLEEISPAWDAWDRLTPWRPSPRKPAEWMRLTHEAAHSIRRAPTLTADAQRALGDARRSMRDPDAVGPALLALREATEPGP